MRNTEIKPNLPVVVRGEPARVSKVLLGAKVEVQLFDSKRMLVVDIDELKPFPTSVDLNDERECEYAPLPVDDDISFETHKLASDRADAIEKFLSGKIKIEQAMEIAKVKKTSFYRLVEMYDPLIGAGSIYPKRPGVKKFDTTISSDVEEIIAAAIEKSYKGKAASFARVWEEVQAQCEKSNKTIPSQSSVRRRVKNVSEKDRYRMKYGSEAARQKFGAKPGRLEASCPLEIVQIDHTVVDCILVDEETREPLFRPWLTLVLDIYTRVILGYYIAYHAPSILTVACAITHAVLPKKQYLNNLGCEDIQHPFFGLPKILHMDNAVEFRTVKLQRACAIHNITPQWRPYGRKHYGGHIERLIGSVMNGRVHFLPGTTMSNVVEKGKYDSQKKSSMTIGEFTKWFAREVEIYNNTKHSALKCTPASKWHKAFMSDNGPLLRIITDPFRFRLDFMPEVRRTIRPVGVELNTYRYWAPELSHHVGLKNVTIKYDPFALCMVWAKIEGEYIELRYANLTDDNRSYEEYLIARSHSSRTEPKGLHPRVIASRDKNEDLVNQSKKDTAKTRKQLKAAAAHSQHVLDQHFDSSGPAPKTITKSNIDFSKSPIISGTEDI